MDCRTYAAKYKECIDAGRSDCNAIFKELERCLIEQTARRALELYGQSPYA